MTIRVCIAGPASLNTPVLRELGIDKIGQQIKIKEYLKNQRESKTHSSGNAAVQGKQRSKHAVPLDAVHYCTCVQPPACAAAVLVSVGLHA